jgi:hypothetical protein
MERHGDVPRFGLGWVCWLVGGLAALVDGIGALGRTRFREPAYLAAGFLVSALTTLALAVLVGWVVWRVAGRSRRAGQVAFVLMLLLTLTGRAVGVVKHAIAFNTAQQLREVQARRLDDLMAKLPEPLAREQIPAALARLDAYFDPVAARAMWDGKTLVETVRAHHRISAASVLDLKMAVDAIQDVEPTDFSGAGHAPERARRRAALRAAIDANERLRQFQAGQLPALREQVAALEGFDRFADAIVEDVSHPGILIGPLDAQAALFTQLLALYDFLDARPAAWRVAADGTLAFTRSEDAAGFQAGLDAMHRLLEETARQNAQELKTATPSTP